MKELKSLVFVALFVVAGIMLVMLVLRGRDDPRHRTPAALSASSASASSTGVGAIPRRASYTVGVLYWSMSIPGQVAMRKGLEAEAQRLNDEASGLERPSLTVVPHVAGDGRGGIDRQIQQMGELIRQRVDLIIAQPTDNAALTAPLEAANEAGIPVVAYDQYISGGKLASYITSDNYQAGYLDGEYVAASFDDSRKLKLVLVEYPHVSSTVERVDGFLDALKDYEQPFVVRKTYRAVEPESGRLAGQQFLKDFPVSGSIDVIFTVNDGGGMAVVEQLLDAGRHEIFVATIDGDPKSVELIHKQRLIRIDSAQFCGALGAEAMKTAYAILRGQRVHPHILVPVFPVTRETVQRYGGWLAPIPERFEKPWVSKQPFWDGKLRIIE